MSLVQQPAIKLVTRALSTDLTKAGRGRWLPVAVMLMVASMSASAQNLPPSRSITHPFVGMPGASTMHGDTAASDTTTLPGPGVGGVRSVFRPLAAACPAVLVRRDGKPMALCTSFFGRKPVIHLLDAEGGQSLAQLTLEAGGLLGGIYGYLDQQDRMVMVDGQQNLIRAAAHLQPSLWGSKWRITIEARTPLADAIEAHCGAPGCDTVTSVSPDGQGHVWFATQKALVGKVDAGTGQVSVVKLNEGERVDNSIANTVDGRVAVVTDKALYLLTQGSDGTPAVRWRAAYDAGSHRKPGQLSRGSGSTPTFFGPGDGSDYLAITDNADERIALLVFDARAGGATAPAPASTPQVPERLPLCTQALFEAGTSGTENSPIGLGRQVYVAATYGYPYPAVPEGAPPAVPAKADFVGGMARVDISLDGRSCRLVWQNKLRSAAVPKLSTADGLIYTVQRLRPSGGDGTTLFDQYVFTAMAPDTGATLSSSRIGQGVFADTLQMAGNIGLARVFWQGTVGGVVRVAPR